MVCATVEMRCLDDHLGAKVDSPTNADLFGPLDASI
jgi:hypothetical protein